MGSDAMESPIGRHQNIPFGDRGLEASLENIEVTRQLGERAHAFLEQFKLNPIIPGLLASKDYQDLLSQLTLSEQQFTNPKITGESSLY